MQPNTVRLAITLSSSSAMDGIFSRFCLDAERASSERRGSSSDPLPLRSYGLHDVWPARMNNSVDHLSFELRRGV